MQAARTAGPQHAGSSTRVRTADFHAKVIAAASDRGNPAGVLDAVLLPCPDRRMAEQQPPDDPTHFGAPPSTEDIVALAERALAAIPPVLSQHVRGMGIMVEDMADDA